MAKVAKSIFKLVSKSIVDDRPNHITKYLDKLSLEKAPQKEKIYIYWFNVYFLTDISSVEIS